MTGHFRSVFYDAGGVPVNRSEILRTLWREHPEASCAQIKARLAQMGHDCAGSLVRATRQEVASDGVLEPNKPQEYTLDEIRVVRGAAEQLGGLLRLAALVSKLVEIRGQLLNVQSTQ